LLALLLLLLLTYREEHISRKIDGMVAEAKAKLAKGDKKGRDLARVYSLELILCSDTHTHKTPMDLYHCIALLELEYQVHSLP
jgi:hypothetical protein